MADDKSGGAFRYPGQVIEREGPNAGRKVDAHITVCTECGSQTWLVLTIKNPDCSGSPCHLQCSDCGMTVCGDGIDVYQDFTEEERDTAQAFMRHLQAKRAVKSVLNALRAYPTSDSDGPVPN